MYFYVNGSRSEQLFIPPEGPDLLTAFSLPEFPRSQELSSSCKKKKKKV